VSGLQGGPKQAAVASSAASHTLSGSGSGSSEQQLEEVPMPVSQLLFFLFAHQQYQDGPDLSFRCYQCA
jgi:uncharacterized damage-inducible protein DinB